MNNEFTNSRILISNIRHPYIKIILAISAMILYIYFFINMFILHRLVIGITCLVVGIIITIEYIYAKLKNKFIYNLLFSILGFSLLCLILPFFRGAIVPIGRMWILLLPGICFYTQTIKKALTITISVISIYVVSNIIILNKLDTVNIIINLEGFIVFSLISCMTFFYAKNAIEKGHELEHHHLHNLLTGLPNRKRLQRDIDTNEYKILALINLDGFNNINNLYGADAGDRVLIIISERLKKFIFGRECYKLYKLHADEYAVCVIGSKHIDKDIETLSKLTNSITAMIKIGLFEVFPSVSIGISQGYENIIEDADMALKTAKHSRKNVVLYDESNGLEEKFRKDLMAIFKLKNALQNNGIIPYYQPIVNLSTGLIDKYECLIRLKYLDEIIAPVDFLEISKKIKIYNKLTRIMIDKVFDHFSRNSGNFSINLDCDDLMSNETNKYIYNKIVEYGNGHRIIFEILESQSIENPKKVVHFINSVKKLGCSIAIDDFGSGYSNFDYLIMFKIDFLKIDAALIKNIDVDYNSYIMTKSIVSFAKELGIQTIAEHVDKPSVLRIIKELGIDFGQGYFWSAPQSSLKKNLINTVN